MTERCVGCGAEVPAIEGPVHRYMTSAPACWRRYGELLDVLYSQPTNRAALIMSVDTYAVQHPGAPNPQAIQSVAVHLLNIYGYLVQGRPVKEPQQILSGKAFHATASSLQQEPCWLEPPTFVDALTVLEMPLSGSGDALEAAARVWADSAWEAWNAHHSRVAEWFSRFASP